MPVMTDDLLMIPITGGDYVLIAILVMTGIDIAVIPMPLMIHLVITHDPVITQEAQ